MQYYYVQLIGISQKVDQAGLTSATHNDGERRRLGVCRASHGLGGKVERWMKEGMEGERRRIVGGQRWQQQEGRDCSGLGCRGITWDGEL